MVLIRDIIPETNDAILGELSDSELRQTLALIISPVLRLLAVFPQAKCFCRGSLYSFYYLLTLFLAGISLKPDMLETFLAQNGVIKQ